MKMVPLHVLFIQGYFKIDDKWRRGCLEEKYTCISTES